MYLSDLGISEEDFENVTELSRLIAEVIQAQYDQDKIAAITAEWGIVPFGPEDPQREQLKNISWPLRHAIEKNTRSKPNDK